MNGKTKNEWVWVVACAALGALCFLFKGPLAHLGAWFVASSTRIFWLSALLVSAFLLLFEGVARASNTAFFSTVILGKDGRTSTSKTFVLMWTLLVVWALVALLIAGEFTVNPSTSAVGLLQKGWTHFLTSGLDDAYLVLLGIPAVAAIGAKAIAQGKVESGATPVVPTTADDEKLSSRVAQIFSSDDGETDIGDFQYVLFNLLTAAYFLARMVRQSDPAHPGLPPLPQTLLGLTGVSAALYVGKKAATRTQPTITSVFPSIIAKATDKITIVGVGLTSEPPTAQDPVPQVRVNGLGCPTVARVGANRLEATLPQPLNGTPDTISGTVEVLSSDGFQTPPYTVTISAK